MSENGVPNSTAARSGSAARTAGTVSKPLFMSVVQFAGETAQVVVTFPAAMTPVKAHDYEVTVEIEEVDTAKTGSVKRVYAPDFCRALAKNVAPVECVFAEKELPKPYREGWGEKRLQRWPNGVRYRFAVRPCNCWGAKGEAIYSDWKD